jgi:Ca2+-binding RTX toxin-like protein
VLTSGNIFLEAVDGSFSVQLKYMNASGPSNTPHGDAPENYMIEEVRFADGTVWTGAQVREMARRIDGTADADTLYGSDDDDLIYGYAGNDRIEAGNGNDLLDGGLGNDTLIGGSGNDTYVVDSASDVVTESSNAGIDTILSSITKTLGSNVENLTLTGTSAINATGNSLNNVLVGNSAANTLSGGTGADTMSGGAGNDTYVVDNVADVVVELVGEGADLVQSSVTVTLSANVENATLTGSSVIDAIGNELGNSLVGNSAANTLTGNAGDDTLNGGAGNDTLVGGTGNDVYVVDSASDAVVELLDEGTDLVQSSVAYTLSANVENLTLTGSSTLNGTGNSLANMLTGNGANNTLTGGGGNDTLDGGLGNDTLVGAAGDDTYVVNVSTDVVTELANEGVDTVQSFVTWTLASTANVENVTLTGNGAINATGNAANNWLIGNTANNTLTGAGGNDTLDGGLGNDTLVGGTGDDTYVVNVSTDVITENASEGTDTVLSAAAWTLSANLENLTLTGTAAINGTGNASANVLLGNSGSNTLSGLGGADSIDGGAGNDTLNGGAGADVYAFGIGYGVDTVQDNDATAGVKDRVQFGAGIAQTDLTYAKVGNNLVASINGTADKLIVQDWYLGSQYHVEEFRFNDGSVVTDAQVQGLVSAMAGFSATAGLVAQSEHVWRGTQPGHILAASSI